MFLKDLKKGEFFTKKPLSEPKESQVWIRQEYDRSAHKYWCQRWDDVSDFCLMSGLKEVYTEFTF